MGANRRVESAWDFLAVENARTKQLAPDLKADVLAIGGGHAVFLRGVALLQAHGLGLSGEVGSEDLERMERFFHDRGAQTKVEVASTADPSLLVALGLAVT